MVKRNKRKASTTVVKITKKEEEPVAEPVVEEEPEEEEAAAVDEKEEEANAEETETGDTEEAATEETEEATEDADEGKENEEAEEEEAAETVEKTPRQPRDHTLQHLLSCACMSAGVPPPKWIENGKVWVQGKRDSKRGNERAKLRPLPTPPYTIKLECAGKAIEIKFPDDVKQMWGCKEIIRDLFIKNVWPEHEIREAAEAYVETELSDIDGYDAILKADREGRVKRCETACKAFDKLEDESEKAYKVEVCKRKHNVCEGDDIEWPAYEDLIEISKTNDVEETNTMKFNLAIAAYNLHFNEFTYSNEDAKHKCSVTVKKREAGKSLKDCEEVFTMEHEEEFAAIDYKELLEDLLCTPRESGIRVDRHGNIWGVDSAARKVEPRHIIREQVCELSLDKLVADGIMNEDDDLKALASKNREKMRKQKRKKERANNDRRTNGASKVGDKRKADAGKGKNPTRDGWAPKKSRGGAKNVFRNTPRNNTGSVYRTSQPVYPNRVMPAPAMQMHPGMHPQMAAAQHQQAMYAMQQRHMQEMQAMNQMYMHQQAGAQPQQQYPGQPGRRW